MAQKQLQQGKDGLPIVNVRDGGYIPVVDSSNITTKFRESFEAFDVVNKWAQVLGPGADIIAVDGNTIAASYLVVSKCPLTPGSLSSVETVASFEMPIECSFGVSMSQRTLGQEFALEIVDVDTPIEPKADVAISAIQQAASVLSITTATPHGYFPGARVGVSGCADSRLNYPALVVATAPTPTTLTLTAGPGGTIPSVNAGPFASGFLYARSALGYAQNGASQIFENATATNCAFYIRSESGDVLPSGTANGNHAVTCGTTVGTQAVVTPRCYAWQPATEFRFAMQADRCQWHDSAVDAITGTANRATRTQVIPDPANAYKFRIRATNNKGLTVPVGRIVSAVKTASTTATITTDVPHGLTTADLIVVYGIRDQAAASFPNLLVATAVASIVSPTVFTVVIGTSSTVTSYGGFVARVNGGNLGSALGYSAIVAQAAVLAAGVLTLTGNASWTGLSIGDYVNVHGCGNAINGTSLGVDGAWRIRDVATTSLVLEPVGATVPPADFGSTNCGGGVIRRTDLRVSFVRIFDFERMRVETLARPTGDVTGGAPVSIQNSPSVTLSGTGAVNVAQVGGSALAAEDAAATATPVLAGGVCRTSTPTTFIAGDAIRDTMTTGGAKVVFPWSVPEAVIGATLALTTTTATPIAAAAGAGLKRHLVGVQATNTGASAVDLIILDGVTERFRIPLPPSNVPVLVNFPVPLVVTANTALNANLSAVGTVRANFQGFTAP